MDKQDYEILCTMVASKERPPEYAVKLLEDTCAKTGLDWKLRHLYLMQKGTKWMVTLSIDGFRLTGSQDPDYGGQEGPYWVTAADGTWSDIPPDGPIYAAKIGIKHKSGITTWGVAKFKDYKAGPMWDKFPSNMSAKCAEMLAWRKAFPGRLGGLYGAEEMEQGQPKKSEPAPSRTFSKEDKERLFLVYKGQIEAQKDPAELKKLGAIIKKDTAIDPEDVLKLSLIFKAQQGLLEKS